VFLLFKFNFLIYYLVLYFITYFLEVKLKFFQG